MITNFEHYKEEIIRICGESFVDNFGMSKDGSINQCRYMDCAQCRFNTDKLDSDCEREALCWLLSGYKGGENGNKL